MLELMLVIVVAAVIILMGLQYYRQANRLMQLSLVRHDIVMIRGALNRFYNAIPCDANGALQTDLNVDVMTQLDLSPAVTTRSPYVMSYHAYIKDSGVVTNQQKPVYTLEVSAVINPLYSGIMTTLTQEWLATRYSGDTIYWDNLSNNTTTDPGSDLWVLTAGRNALRNLKNSAALSAGVQSHAYCAQ